MAIQPAALKTQGSAAAAPVPAGGKSGPSDAPLDGSKKSDAAPVTEVRAINMSRNVTAVGTQPLIAPGEYRLQTQAKYTTLLLWYLTLCLTLCCLAYDI